MKKKILALLIAVSLITIPSAAFAGSDEGAAQTDAAAVASELTDETAAEAEAQETDDAALTAEAAEAEAAVVPESVDDAEEAAPAEADDPAALKAAEAEGWETGWNADRTQYKYIEDGQGMVKGEIAKGLFKAKKNHSEVNAMYYADENGIVRKTSGTVTVSGDKKRYLMTTGGFDVVPASDKNQYTYFINAANDDNWIAETAGIYTNGNVKYFVQSNGTVRTNPGFQAYGSNTYFIQDSTGSIRTTSGFFKFGGKTYLAASGGAVVMNVGLLSYGGKYYCARSDHSIVTTPGIIKIGSYLYYVNDASGALAKNKTVKAGKKKYHVLANGTVALYAHKWKGKYYFSDKNGVLKRKAGIAKSSNGKYYYFKKSGKIVTNKKIKYKKKYYIAGKNGAFKTGLFKWKKAMYYASGKGKLRTKAGMVTVGAYSYYTRSGSGKIYVNTQFKSKGKTYLADKKGHLVSGVYQWKGNYYYADGTFAMRTTPGLIRIGKKYYINNDGGGLARNTFVDYNNTHYYAGSDAVIVTKKFTYKGVTITPTSTGAISDDDYFKVFPEKDPSKKAASKKKKSSTAA